jgi:hypothetical protein
MAKTPVFWGLDVEDANNPESDDALLRLCRIHSDVGIPLNLFFAGQKARFIRRNCRDDVVAALKGHDICYHGNYWFDYPEPALIYGADDDWDTALAKALRYEIPGLNEVAEVTGQFPSAYVQHQTNHSPVTQYAVRQGGVLVNNGGFGDQMPHNAWVMDTLFVGRASRVVSPQGNWSHAWDPLHPERKKPPVNPDEELRNFQENFDRQLALGFDHVNITGHPTCWVCSEWWGWYEFSLPFRLSEGFRPVGPFTHDRQWRPAAKRSAADIEAHFEWTRRAAEWLASRNDIECLSLKEYHERHAEPKGQWISMAEVREMCRELTRNFDALKVADTTMSTADALFMLATLGEYVMLHNRLPERLQIRRTLGPVEAVPELSGAVKYLRADYLIAARSVYAYIMAHDRVPSTIRAHSVDAGPGEVLMALAQAFAEDELPEEVTVEATGGLPKCSEFPIFQNARASSTNAPPFYDDSRIAMLCKLQSWSYRPLVKNV